MRLGDAIFRFRWIPEFGRVTTPRHERDSARKYLEEKHYEHFVPVKYYMKKGCHDKTGLRRFIAGRT